MVQHCKIIIRNRSKTARRFYLFQLQPAYVVVGGEVPEVHSCCVCAGEVEPYSMSGAELEFAFKEVVLAGAVHEKSASAGARRFASPTGNDESDALAFAMQRVVGTQSSEDAVSINSTRLSVAPLGLSPSINEAGVTLRSFRVHTPAVLDEELVDVYCGNAIQHQDGQVVLSSFVRPPSDSRVDCAPLFAFWLDTGSFEEGQVVPSNRSGSAPVLIEFAFDGPQVVIADYNEDGTFSPGD
ncbi:hypothetical protein PSE_3824 [Pseudovibrio sp. FO-BEG1]|uniref:hypothetical protein n=1 Tax=Pseudovibrio sp. (strain FO-BEG1) TaxID=911045 RepID=UPI000238C449|nr:hypothetical protein [Pseudovibrio sp. FO-BEG1]AEV38328.1 hypothetical protein PSE_3824 [Pseudovibrio sp. FO-BEG1]